LKATVISFNSAIFISVKMYQIWQTECIASTISDNMVGERHIRSINKGIQSLPHADAGTGQ
jgi:hypothetical protein